MNGNSLFNDSPLEFASEESITHQYQPSESPAAECAPHVLEHPLALTCLLDKTKLSVAFAKEAAHFLSKNVQS